MDATAAYRLSIEKRRYGWSRPLRVVASVVERVLLGNTQTPALGDCVVRRTADGREVLRLGDDGSTYFEVEKQLATMTAAEFAETWGIED